MGIRIDGASDLINATDGSLTIEGQSINSTGIGTFSGGVKVGSAATIHSTGQFNIGVAHTLFANGNATHSGIVTTAGATINGITQITKGASGGATANTDAALIIDNSSNTYVQFRTPASNESGLLFGDNADNDAGAVTYNHSSNHLGFRINADERLRIRSTGNIDIPTGNLGIHTTDANTEHIAGAASSFIGLYLNDGYIGFPTALNRNGGYFIATTVNALNAGPVSLGSSMTLHGTWTIV